MDVPSGSVLRWLVAQRSMALALSLVLASCASRPVGGLGSPSSPGPTSIGDPKQITSNLAASVSAPDLVVCSWNIKWFGSKELSRYDLARIADSMRRCDVVAVQELKGAHAHAAMAALQERLNEQDGAWIGTVSGETGYRDNDDPGKNNYLERFGFLWNADRVSLVGEARFLDEPIVNHPTFRQVPWIAGFRVNGGGGFDFDLLTAHTVYKAELHDVRRQEISAIVDWILSADSRSESNAFAIGDFNANPKGQPKHFAEILPVERADLRNLMVEPIRAGERSVRTTVPTRDAEPGTRYYEMPVYDHILASLSNQEALVEDPMLFSTGAIGVDRFDDASDWEEPRNVRRSVVSDHRLIWMTLDYEARDED